jgi:hypothetical protein
VSSESKARGVLTAPDECQSSAAVIGSSLTQSAEREFHATLQLLVERGRFLTAARSVAIAVEQERQFVYAAATGDSAPEVNSKVDLAADLIQQCLQNRKPVFSAADAFPSLVVPIIREDKMSGFFKLLGEAKFEDRDEQAIVRLAEMVNTAIDHRDAAVRAEECTFERASDSTFPTLWHAPNDSETSPAQSPHSNLNVAALEVQKCVSCGFPVSRGRTFCLDCEKHSAVPPAAVELFSTQEQESWFSAHGYTIASILISALVIAIILWLR